MQCVCVVCEVFLDGDRTAALAVGWLSIVDSALPHAHLPVADFLISREVVGPDCGDGMLCDICTSLVITCDASYGRYIVDLEALRHRRVPSSSADDEVPSEAAELVAEDQKGTEEGKLVPHVEPHGSCDNLEPTTNEPSNHEEEPAGRQTRSTTKSQRVTRSKGVPVASTSTVAKKRGRAKSKKAARPAAKKVKLEADEDERSSQEKENQATPVDEPTAKVEEEEVEELGQEKENLEVPGDETTECKEVDETSEPPSSENEEHEEEGDENLEEQSDVDFGPNGENYPKKSTKSKIFRGKWYKCSECNFQAKWRVNLNFHVKRHHQNVSPFVCKICGEGFASTISKSTHMQKVHEQKAKYACDHCDKSFYSKNGLNYHLKSIQAGEEQERLMCNICGDQVPSYQLASHMHRLHRKKKLVGYFPCELCPEIVYKHKISLIRHMASIHGVGEAKPKPENQGYVCPDCGKKIRTREYYLAHRFQEHKISMPGLKEYNCSYCGKMWYVKRAYEAHVAMHTGERTFKCKFCTYSSNHSGNICVHMRRVHPVEYNLIKKQPKDVKPVVPPPAPVVEAPLPASFIEVSPPAPSVEVPLPATFVEVSPPAPSIEILQHASPIEAPRPPLPAPFVEAPPPAPSIKIPQPASPIEAPRPAPLIKILPPPYVPPPRPRPPPSVAVSQQPTTIHSQIIITEAPSIVVSQPMDTFDTNQVIHFAPSLVPLEGKAYEIPFRDCGPTIVATRVMDTGEVQTKPVRPETVEAKIIITHVRENTIEPH